MTVESKCIMTCSCGYVHFFLDFIISSTVLVFMQILFSFFLKPSNVQGWGGGSNGPPLGFSDQKFEALKQSKYNF